MRVDEVPVPDVKLDGEPLDDREEGVGGEQMTYLDAEWDGDPLDDGEEGVGGEQMTYLDAEWDGEPLDDREEGVGGEHGSLVSLRVDDLAQRRMRSREPSVNVKEN